MMDNFTSNNNSQFYWWFGVVEDRDDPLRLGRCKLRILGYHVDDKEILPTDDLPWAIPIMPANSAGTSGVGWSPTGAVEGSWCIGFFADGENGQHPMFFGTVGAIPGGLSPTGCTDGSNDSGQPGDSATDDGSSANPAKPVSSAIAIEREGILERYLDSKKYSLLAKAAIMAQCRVESGNFRFLEEQGSRGYFAGKKYGFKYRGRGFIQLTWDYNYKSATADLKIDLYNNPDKAAEVDIACQLVDWYFRTQRPNIGKKNKWNDINAVTQAVNGRACCAANDGEGRKSNFVYYKKKYGVVG
jgi:predicted chitinase